MASHRLLQWPEGLRPTVKREMWFERLKAIKPGLRLEALAKRLKTRYTTAQRWAKIFGYEIRDMRKDGAVGWDQVDWSRRDAILSRDLGVSRERVRQVRAERGIGPSAERSAALLFEAYVRHNADSLHGHSVVEVMAMSNIPTTRNAARRVMRKFKIQPFRSEARWNQLSWALPNRDLGEIYRLDPRQVASIRSRLGVGPAKWDISGGRKVDSKAYYRMLDAERRKAAKLNGQLSGGARRKPVAPPAKAKKRPRPVD